MLLASGVFALMNGVITSGDAFLEWGWRVAFLLAVTVASVVWLFATLAGGIVSDRIGRRNTFLLGYAWLILMAFPLFTLINTGSMGMLTLGMCLFAIGRGFTYGPQASWCAELFPANVRFSGVSSAAAMLLQDKRGRSLSINGQEDQERYASLRASKRQRELVESA